jgi:hypothetical protein
MSAELVALVQQIAKDKGLPLEEVLGAMCDGIRHAYEKQFMRNVGRQQRKRIPSPRGRYFGLGKQGVETGFGKNRLWRTRQTHIWKLVWKKQGEIDPNAQLGMRDSC